MKRSHPRQGTAFVITVAVVALLAILLLGYFRTNIARRFSTRFMSNEKRAEALAEASVELVARYLKDNVNDDDDPNLYTYFRFIVGMSGLGRGEGVISPEYYPQPLVFDQLDKKPLNALKALVDEMGGRENVRALKVTCEVVQADGFTSYGNTQIPGITTPPHEAQGEPAQFLDNIDREPADEGLLSSLCSEMGFKFELPNGQMKDQHKIELTGLAAMADGVVYLTKLSPTKVQAYIKITLTILGMTIDLSGMVPNNPRIIDIEEEIRKVVKIPEGKPVSLKTIREMIMGDLGGLPSSMNWKAGILQDSIQIGWDKLPMFPRPIDTPDLRTKRASTYTPEPLLIEKGGILRLTAEVDFYPGGLAGENSFHIRKTLQADREFKVSDLQPAAPEYVLFVANSNLLFERPEDKEAILPATERDKIGQPIDWKYPQAKIKGGIIATFAVHPLPAGPNPNGRGGSYAHLTGFESGGGTAGRDSNCQVPGMIRVNSNGQMQINTFIGTLNEPFLTEFNALAMSKYQLKAVPPFSFQMVPTYNWKDKTTYPDRPHEVDFPVLHNEAKSLRPFLPVGTKNLLKILGQCDGLAAPTLMYGSGHMEYPLGLRAEGNLRMRYGNVHVAVNPKGKMPPDPDITEAFIEYKVPTSDFGLLGQPAFKQDGDWSSSDARNMPANLYSILQYAKKATHYYEDESDFWKDALKPIDQGGRSDNGVFDCTGVTYIKGSKSAPSLHITAANVGAPLWKIKGKGILVVKGNIFVETNLLRDDKDPGTVGKRPGDVVFSLIARAGSINVRQPCSRIEAACYSNTTLTNPAGNSLIIDGNLVMNHFNRADINSVEVYFNGAACRISPLSLMRDVGKFEPRRYHVSLGKRWASMQYVKK